MRDERAQFMNAGDPQPLVAALAIGHHARLRDAEVERGRLDRHADRGAGADFAFSPGKIGEKMMQPPLDMLSAGQSGYRTPAVERQHRQREAGKPEKRIEFSVAEQPGRAVARDVDDTPRIGPTLDNRYAFDNPGLIEEAPAKLVGTDVRRADALNRDVADARAAL